MLCVREDQIAIAQHIIQKFNLIDVIDIRSYEEYVKLNIKLEISGNFPDARK